MRGRKHKCKAQHANPDSHGSPPERFETHYSPATPDSALPRSGVQFDGDEVAHGAGGALVFGDEEAKRARGFAQWFAAVGVGDNYFAGMKGGIDFGEGENDAVAVGTCCDEV